jgi:5-methylcytosine-specific restriction endonuclease McrA
MTAAQRGYGYKWQKARERFLDAHPLCVMCEEENPAVPVPATVVDHKVAHRGDERRLWDQANWQALCAHHHSSVKQRQENEEARK